MNTPSKISPFVAHQLNAKQQFEHNFLKIIICPLCGTISQGMFEFKMHHCECVLN